MTALLAAFLAGAALIAWVVGAPLLERRRRARLRNRPIGRNQRRILRERVGCYARLPAALRVRLDAEVSVFLGEKEFTGCGGLVVTPEMRLVIAAQACLLLLGRDDHPYGPLRSILVYPSQFVVPERWEDESGVVTEELRELSGQAWDTSRIVLSWEDVAGAGEAYNVVIHEFAHYLEHETGGPGVAPWMPEPLRRGWPALVEQELGLLRRRVDAGHETFLDPYAADDSAELFAVASETFFEEPAGLREEHPGLYRSLAAFYRVDPAGW